MLLNGIFIKELEQSFSQGPGKTFKYIQPHTIILKSFARYVDLK